MTRNILEFDPNKQYSEIRQATVNFNPRTCLVKKYGLATQGNLKSIRQGQHFRPFESIIVRWSVGRLTVQVTIK